MDKTRWKFIRSERILRSLEEADLQDLRTATIRGFPGTRARQYATGTVRVIQKVYTPYQGTANLLVESLVDNQGHRYNPEIFFEGVEFEEEDSPNNVTFTATDGEMYHIQPIQFRDNNAKVRCTCLDFHYRFAQTNARDDTLYGNPPPPYQRKTTTRPSVNPQRVPGMCKHLLKLVEELQRDKVVTR